MIFHCVTIKYCNDEDITAFISESAFNSLPSYSFYAFKNCVIQYYWFLSRKEAEKFVSLRQAC